MSLLKAQRVLPFLPPEIVSKILIPEPFTAINIEEITHLWINIRLVSKYYYGLVEAYFAQEILPQMNIDFDLRIAMEKTIVLEILDDEQRPELWDDDIDRCPYTNPGFSFQRFDKQGAVAVFTVDRYIRERHEYDEETFYENQCSILGEMEEESFHDPFLANGFRHIIQICGAFRDTELPAFEIHRLRHEVRFDWKGAMSKLCAEENKYLLNRKQIETAPLSALTGTGCCSWCKFLKTAKCQRPHDCARWHLQKGRYTQWFKDLFDCEGLDGILRGRQWRGDLEDRAMTTMFATYKERYLWKIKSSGFRIGEVNDDDEILSVNGIELVDIVTESEEARWSREEDEASIDKDEMDEADRVMMLHNS